MSYSALSIELQESSPPAWVDQVIEDFDPFLVDHAACERKASGTAVSLTVAYPDRSKLVDEMIGLAREELQHYHQVNRLMVKRGVRFTADEKDPYVTELIKEARHGREERLLDRLLIFGLVEARGCERFGLLGEHLPDEELAQFYKKLAAAESRHHDLFIRLALHYFEKDEVEKRLKILSEKEKQIMRKVPIRSAVH